MADTSSSSKLSAALAGAAASSTAAAASAMAQDLERRQHSYVRRERDYKTKIELLEAELSKAKSTTAQSVADVEAEKHMGKLRELHSTIVANIDHVQEQTARILQEQERDLLRAFRARIFDLQTELEKEKSRAEDGAAVWIEKNRQLQKELDWAKEMADRLDRHNQALMRETARLTTQYKTQEDDREYLIKQLVAAKKDNARLRTELNKSREDMAGLQSEIEDVRMRSTQMPMVESAGQALRATAGGVDTIDADVKAIVSNGDAPEASMPAADEARYRDIIMRLKKLLDAERKAARQLRSQLTAELAARTEAEMFLRRAIEDARVEIERKRQAVLGPSASTSPRARSPGGGLGRRRSHDATAPADAYAAIAKEDREQILASLLAQDHVLTALQRISFPANADDVVSPTTEAPDSPVSAAAGGFGTRASSVPPSHDAGEHFPLGATRASAAAAPAAPVVERFRTSTLGRSAASSMFTSPPRTTISGPPPPAAAPSGGAFTSGRSPRPSPALAGVLASTGVKR